MNRIIDTHAYVGSNKMLGVDSKPEIYIALKDKILKTTGHSIRFLLMAYSKGDNFELPKIIAENPDLFLGGYLQINPNKSLERMLGYSSPSELEGIIKSGKIVGLKLHTSMTKTRVDSDSLDEFSKLAIDYDLPIMFHCAATGQKFAHPDFFRRLRDKNRNLKIICAHYGGLNEEYIPEYIDLVVEDSQMYLNTTGLSGDIKRWIVENSPPAIYFEKNAQRWEKLFSETIGAIKKKVIFGSDFPELDFSLHPINMANQEIQRKVLHDNAVKLFRLENIF